MVWVKLRKEQQRCSVTAVPCLYYSCLIYLWQLLSLWPIYGLWEPLLSNLKKNLYLEAKVWWSCPQFSSILWGVWLEHCPSACPEVSPKICFDGHNTCCWVQCLKNSFYHNKSKTISHWCPGDFVVYNSSFILLSVNFMVKVLMYLFYRYIRVCTLLNTHIIHVL